MLKPPLATSIAPSSPISPCSRPPSTPTTVQYGCSPWKPRGYLGVTFEAGQPAIDDVRDGELYIRFVQYPQIALVEPNSPAERAGILVGDTLVELNGTDVRKEISLTRLLVPDARVSVRVRRDGDARNIRVIVGEAPQYYTLRATPLPRTAPAPQRVEPCPEERLGAAFDQRKFHDAILALGSVPLPALEERMAKFIADGGENPAAAPPR